MGRITDFLTVTDALGEKHTPRVLARRTAILLVETVILVVLLLLVAVAWEALH